MCFNLERASEFRLVVGAVHRLSRSNPSPTQCSHQYLAGSHALVPLGGEGGKGDVAR
eukprot:COSAG01_NODE_1731_length_9369_cov_35.048220_6_plen_57_part_00